MGRVAVVGAGMSGLVAAKELLDEGQEVVLFEQQPEIGGTFTTGVAYDRMYLTVSNHFMAFSSLAPPDNQERYFWTRAEYIAYLKRFVETFGLAAYTRLGTAVRGVRREVDGSWIVKSVSADGEREERFSAVAICRGAFRGEHPRMIPLPGRETFDGEIVHTANWKGAEPFRGKKVVCIGMGETSADITKWISDVAAECWLAMRNPPRLIERYPYGGADTNDAFTTRFTHWVYNSLRSRDPAQRPARAKARLLGHQFGEAQEKRLHEMPPHNRLVMEWSAKASLGRFLQKNDVFVDNVLDGKIKPIFSGVKHIDGKRVEFEDGKTVEADIIMLCTGYEESAIPSDWVEGLTVSDVRTMFKHAFHPDFPGLAFIGWVRPTQGGVPQASEMVARYFSLLCSGKRTLPEPAEMRKCIEADAARESAQTDGNPYMRTLTEFTSFMDSMADLIGCNPSLPDYVDDPDLLYRLACGSNVASCYRLVGPHANPTQARELLLRLPVALESSVSHRETFELNLSVFADLIPMKPADKPKCEKILEIIKTRYVAACEGKPKTYVQKIAPCFS